MNVVRRSVRALRRRRAREERGAVLLMGSVLMVVLLLMSAAVVDVGRLILVRRSDQAAADMAVIAGAMNRASDANLVNSVLESLNANLGAEYTAADLMTCGSAPLPDGFVAYPTFNCLSHDSSWTQLQLILPEKSFPTAFASLAGIDEFTHTARARVYDRRGGLVLPFAISSTAGTYECLKVGAANVPDPACNSNTSGNFGVVTFGIWGNSSMGTTQDCTGTNNQFVVNVVQGVDHDLSIFGGAPHGSDQVVDSATCGAQPRPNAMTTTTGNTPQLLGAALFGPGIYPDGGPSRFRRLGTTSLFDDTSVAGATVDDTPLWDFIDGNLHSGDDVPRSCYRDQFVGDGGGLNPDNDQYMSNLPLSVANHLLLVPLEDRMIKLIERCLTHYEGDAWDDGGALSPADPMVGCNVICSDPVFSHDSATEDDDLFDIQFSPRFGYVPQLTNDSTMTGNSTVRIANFRAVFLQRIYGGNCSNSGCPVTFDPGVEYSDNVGTNKASALTAFVFPPGILPNGLADLNALENYDSTRRVELIR